MSKKVIALLIAVLMLGTVASAATMVKSSKTTVKGNKTVIKKHFKRTTNKKVKTTAIKSTTVPNPANPATVK